MRMPIDMKEIRDKAREMFANFSDLLKKEVRGSDGELIGRVWDAAVRTGEVYPRVYELIIAKGFFKRLYASVPWSMVHSMDDDITLSKTAAGLIFSGTVHDYELLLKRDVLDQQVVDTFNHKVWCH